MPKKLEAATGQNTSPAEVYTPEGRAMLFMVQAWLHSSNKFEVDALCDKGEAMVHCKIRRQILTPDVDKPLQRYQVSGLMDALNSKADEFGGEGTGLWTPDSENEHVQKSWSRVFTFLLDDLPVDLSP